ncbi:MAG: hypothetical protein L6R42_000160 [Xanthoria sp. 1 TBL-2021]|nr:MAG: hypothetical protein L6R42_000160 [Xanthoria sp. 1 TBL-2021]
MQGRAENGSDNLSSSSEFDHLRPQSEVESSNAQAEAVVQPPASSTAFSTAAKRGIEVDGSNCWHCSSIDGLHHAHIIAQSKRAMLGRLRERGLTNIDGLHQKDNGICLCVRCHTALDDVEDPGWVFVPTNLDFFLSAERSDHRLRVAAFQYSGYTIFPRRTPPTPDSYILGHSSYRGQRDSRLEAHRCPWQRHS